MGNYCTRCFRVIVRTPHDCTRTTRSFDLTETMRAGLSDTTNLHAAAMVVETVNTATRTVSGTLIPYGEVGYTDAGPVIVPGPGRVVIPARELWGRVKLVDEHQNPPVSVGYATNIQDRDNALRAEFRIAETPDGDRVLAEFTPDSGGGRARDGFSVELVNIQLRDAGGGVGELVTGQLSLVAAVTAPAWDNAREDGLAASINNGRNTMLTEAQRARLTELLAMANRTDEQDTELRQLLELASDSVQPDEGGDEGDGDEGDGDEGDGDGDEGTQTGGQLAAGRQRRQRSARVPGSVPGRRGRQRQGRDIRELYAATARVLSGQSRPELEAALSDITNTANIWVAGTDYAGQLWSGLTYQRRYIPLMTPGELRNYKGSGWRWNVKPEVADYAGDKAAVPSNVPSTEEADWTAARLAGAHDLDRKFWDFGDQEFIAAYYEAMTESYAVKSDDKARAFILASAAAIAGAETSLFRAAAVAAQAVEDNTLGATVDYFLINSADKLSLLDITQNDIPAYLETFGVTPDKFQSAPGVAAGTVVAGTRQASRFRELSSSPIRVEAINVANGGVDGGVFGYYATELLHEGGIVSKTFA